MAIDVAIGLATEGVGAVAMRGIKIVAERITETATRVVIRAANRAARGVPRSGILKEVVIPDSAIDPKIKKAVMDEDLLGTLSHRQDMARRGEQVDPTVEKPDGGSIKSNGTGTIEPYNRRKHYGSTPSKSDRKVLGAGPDQVVDHDPPLVQRYYDGDPATGEKPGMHMTPDERKASGKDRERMKLQFRNDSNKQGGEMSAYSRKKREKLNLDPND